MSRGTLRVSNRKKTKFLRALASTGLVKDAAKISGCSVSYFYKLRDSDAEFAAAWAQAVEESDDILEKVAWERATEGVEKPIYFKGKAVGTHKEPSDRLLEFLMRGKRPDVYGDRTKLESKGLDSIGNLLETIARSGSSTQSRLSRTIDAPAIDDQDKSFLIKNDNAKNHEEIPVDRSE